MSRAAVKILKFLVFAFWLSAAHAEPKLTMRAKNAIDVFIKRSMQTERVPVVSIAVIDHGKIVYARAYSHNQTLKVNTHTVFQSASLSKSVAALGALILVDQARLGLDRDINLDLKSWKIPDSTYTQHAHVTLRNLLSMTSGLSVSGFGGQSSQDPIPSLKQILNGQPPADNKPVRVTFVPGSQYDYSVGGYEVVEQLIEDATRQTFQMWMHKTVLSPLMMQDSQFKADVPSELSDQAVPGFLKEGKMISGKWKMMPALAAGGLWSTPTDMAKFAIGIIHAFQGRAGSILSKQLANIMLTRQDHTDFGLGFVIDGCGEFLNFRKQGHNLGFYNQLIVFPQTQQGVVIMTNSENGFLLIQSIIPMLSKRLKWPSHHPIRDESVRMQVHSSCD